MQAHDQRIIHSSEESGWRTPQPCFDLLDKEFSFFADLAANQVDHLCSNWYGPGHVSAARQNSLVVPWHAHLEGKSGFLNPPYSKKQYRETQDPAFLIENWAVKCWVESQAGCTIVGIFPFAPQTDWYRTYVYGHRSHNYQVPEETWSGHAAMEERRLPHRISFLRPDGSPAGNAGVNSAIIIWKPNPGYVGPWVPTTRYWSYR